MVRIQLLESPDENPLHAPVKALERFGVLLPPVLVADPKNALEL